MMEIRPANEQTDLKQLPFLWKELFSLHVSWGYVFEVSDRMAEEWVRSFQNILGKYAFLWVAVESEKIYGFVLMRLIYSPAFMGRLPLAQISELYVDSTRRNERIGQKLVAVAMDKARELGVHSIEVQTMVLNKNGQRFWENQGLVPEHVKFRKVFER